MVSRGRNRVFEPQTEHPFLAGHRLAHAEVNALVGLDYASVDPLDCTLYTTTEPCPLCTGAVRVSRLREVRYASRDTVGGSTGLLEATEYMRRQGIRVVGPERADLEAIIVALHVEFALRTGLAGGERIAAWWEPALPEGVRLGRSLHESGELYRMGKANVPVGEVIGWLGEMLEQAWLST